LEPKVANISTLTTTAGTAVPKITLRELPNTAAEALNIPDSVEDVAENGSYMVATMDGPTNEVNQVVNQGNSANCPELNSGGITYFPLINGAAFPFSVSGVSNTKIPYNAFGAYFNNLSQQTKLKVIMHAFIEEFPPPSSTLLTALATPSANYDPEALVLYSKAVRQLPVAVPASENFFGTFFLEAAKSIANWAAPKLLKGWGKTGEEESELKKIKSELEVLKGMRQLELEERRRPIPRVVVSDANGTKIVRTPKAPPLPPRDYPRGQKNFPHPMNPKPKPPNNNNNNNNIPREK
jgi:hypothetical protein